MGASIERRVDLEMVVDPERLEAERLGLAGRPRPCAPRRVAGVEAEVLAVAALGQREPTFMASSALRSSIGHRTCLDQLA